MKTKTVVFPEAYKVVIEESDMDIEAKKPNDLFLKTQYSVLSAGTEGALYKGTETWAKHPILPGYGAVIKDAKVLIELMKHSFPWTGVINYNQYFGHKRFPDTDPEQYKKMIPVFFNRGGFELLLKYKQGYNKTDKIAKIINDFKDMGMDMRGHALMWPSGAFLHKEMQTINMLKDI
jgi:hypothetical protein